MVAILVQARGILLLTFDPLWWHELTLIPEWVSNYIHYNVYDEITYQSQNINSSSTEV